MIHSYRYVYLQQNKKQNKTGRKPPKCQKEKHFYLPFVFPKKNPEKDKLAM
jgi:hypothetical protein